MTMPQKAEPVHSRPAPNIEPLKIALVERPVSAARVPAAALATLASQPAPTPVRSAAPRDADVAMSLLTEVSGAMDIMQTRCDQLAAMIAGTDEQAEIDLAALNEDGAYWQQAAMDLKAQAEHLAEVTAQVQRRAEVSEAQAAALHASSTTANQRTAEASALTAIFRGTIVSSFGAGSKGSAALQVISGRAPIVTI